MFKAQYVGLSGMDLADSSDLTLITETSYHHLSTWAWQSRTDEGCSSIFIANYAFFQPHSSRFWALHQVKKKRLGTTALKHLKQSLILLMRSKECTKHPSSSFQDPSGRVLTDAGHLKHRVCCDSRSEGRFIEKSGRNVETKSEEMWRCTCECCQHVSNSMQRQPCLIYTNLYTHTASPSKTLSFHICQESGARLTTHSQILINKRLAF